MTKRKIIKFTSIAAIALTVFLTGCGSSKASNQIKNGDYVTAIETLSAKLTKKPTDKDSADLFVSIYPAAAEQRIPEKTVAGIIDEVLSPYGSTQTSALKNLAKELSLDMNLSSHEKVANIIRRAERNIANLSDLVRIQRAVATVPYEIGNPKKGPTYEVKKYTEDFNAKYQQDVHDFAMFYYNLGETLYPGENMRQKKEILEYYKKANTYEAGISNVKNHAAEICYQIALLYENEANTVDYKKEAISWYNAALSWVSNYKDAQTQVYRLNYEIAMYLKSSATSTSDYELVISYFNLAGSYKDTDIQKREATYTLAYLYKNEYTASSYEKAGSLFTSLGSYKNSANEAALYQWYKRLIGLSKTDKSGNTSLNTGYSRNTVSRQIENSSSQYTNLNITNTGSNIDVYYGGKKSEVAPGSMFDGGTLASGKFTPYSGGTRNSLRFTIGNTKTAEMGKGLIQYPATEEANDDVLDVAVNYSRKITPDVTYEFYPIYSKDDLEATLGMGYNRSKLSFSSSMFNRNVVLVKVTQYYYSASVAAPALPIQFFDPEVDGVSSSSLKSVTPYYISASNYGRQAYILIASDLSQDDIILDFKQYRPKDSKNSGSSARSVSSDLTRNWKSGNTTVKAYVVGEKSTTYSSIDDVYKWIKNGSDNKVDIEDIPVISFQLRSLSANDYACLTTSNKVKIYNPYYVEPTEEDEPTTTYTPTTTRNPSPTGVSRVPTTTGTTTTGTTTTGTTTTGTTTGTTTTGTTTTGSSSTDIARATYDYTLPCIVLIDYNGKRYTYTSFKDNVWLYTIPLSTIAKEDYYFRMDWDTKIVQSVKLNGQNMVRGGTTSNVFYYTHETNISLDIVYADGTSKHYLICAQAR